MKAGLGAVAAWTPERGPLDATGRRMRMRRFERALVHVVETIVEPSPRCCVVVGSSEGTGDDAPWPGPELASYWGCSWRAVASQAEAVPMSLADAMLAAAEFETVVWAVVDLCPAAELATAAVLHASPTGRSIRLAHRRSPRAAQASLRGEPRNPSAAALELIRRAQAPETPEVSVDVGRWVVSVSAGSRL